MENLGKFITLLIALTINPIINGLVFYQLWNWIISPIFKINQLSIIHAIGITIFIGFILVKFKKIDKNEDKDEQWNNMWKSIFFNIAMSLIAIFYGWIVTLFM